MGYFLYQFIAKQKLENRFIMNLMCIYKGNNVKVTMCEKLVLRTL